LVAAAFGTTPACLTKDCEGVEYQAWGDAPGQGIFLDDNTWITTNVDDPWLDFPPGRIWGLDPPGWKDQGREPTEMQAWVSAGPNPNDGGDNWSQASGNLAEFWGAAPGHINVSNATCAHWYLRVLLRAAPRDASSSDAPADAPADASEAGADAGDGGGDAPLTDGQSGQ
jgi:hypothetical protein